MNLMDMLSGDVDSYNDMSYESQLNVIDVQPDKVYYVPTQLCPLQRHLVDVMIQMFKIELLHEINCNKKKPSIASLLDTNDDLEMYNIYDKIQLLFDQLLVIDKHPSLIVDHFIPKKLILLEINNRLLTLSGKFQFLNRFIDELIEHNTSVDGFHILLVAQSVRELELIEGLIIGKCLYYANLSNSKLYDDKAVPSSYKNLLCLYLITSSQLYNNYIPSSNSGDSKFNLIISFDISLDPTNPSIQMVRQQQEIPILIPVPLYSMEYIMQQTPQAQTNSFISKEENDPAHKWRLKVIQTLIMNRDNLLHDEVDFFVKTYGPNMENLINWIYKNDRFPINMSTYDAKFVLEFSDEDLINKMEHCYNEDYAQLHKFDYESYKSTLAEVLNIKLQQLQDSIQYKVDVQIPSLRIDESRRQVNYDEDEDQIAAKFNKLKKLNEEASAAEKKLARTENYVTKYHTINDDLTEKHQYLQSIEKSREFNFQHQDECLKSLQEELAVLTEEYNKLNGEYDDSRIKYQTSSTEAVQLSNKLQKLNKQNGEITKQLTGIGIQSLPQLIRNDTSLTYTQTLNRIKQENEFIVKFFKERIDQLTVERQQILDTTGTGSSTRPSNRISRASTPF